MRGIYSLSLIISFFHTTQGFSVSTCPNRILPTKSLAPSCAHSVVSYPPLLSSSRLMNRDRRRDDYYDDDKDDDYEYARVRRRGGGRRYKDDYDDEYEYYDDVDEYERPKRKSRVKSYVNDDLDDDEIDDEDDFDLDEMVENIDWSVTIPNPILDNVDPDRATDRMGDVVKDPAFWRDMSILGVLIWIWVASAPPSYMAGHDWLL